MTRMEFSSHGGLRTLSLGSTRLHSASLSSTASIHRTVNMSVLAHSVLVIGRIVLCSRQCVVSDPGLHWFHGCCTSRILEE